jgi:hypothetical protein
MTEYEVLSLVFQFGGFVAALIIGLVTVVIAIINLKSEK